MQRVIKPYIKFTSSAGNETYEVNVEEHWLYSRLVHAVLSNFTKKDMREHGEEIWAQILCELVTGNVHYILE